MGECAEYDAYDGSSANDCEDFIGEARDSPAIVQSKAEDRGAEWGEEE